MGMGWTLRIGIVFLFCTISINCQRRKLYFVKLPSIIRLDVEEYASVSMENVASQVVVELIVKDASNKVLLTRSGPCKEGSPATLSIKVNSVSLGRPSKDKKKEYVFVTAKSTAASFQFERTVRVLVSRRSKLIYVQTDKPIYTPMQTVRFRVIPVDIELKPTMAQGVIVNVRNPDDKITQRWDRIISTEEYAAMEFGLGDTPFIGNWTITAEYDGQNTSVKFEVREYVLPRFSVKISPPPYILNFTYETRISISSRYVYGKSVRGRVNVKVGVINDRNEITPVIEYSDTLIDGDAEFSLNTETLRKKQPAIWFPDRDRLNIVAVVTEKETGHKESTTDTSVYFSTTPYVITYPKSMAHFKPGLPYEVLVTVKYPNKRPAPYSRIVLRGKVTDDSGKQFDVTEYKSTSLEIAVNENGEGKGILDIPVNAVELHVEAKVSEVIRIPNEYNKPSKFTVLPVTSPTRSYILIRTPSSRPKIGSGAEFEIITKSKAKVKVLHYMVLSRGRVLVTRSFVNPGPITVARFQVMKSMCPRIRFVAFYNVENGGGVETVADQVLVDVEDKFNNEVVIKTDKTKFKPGDSVKIKVMGHPGSKAAILAVDNSVYLLRDDNRFNAERVFRRMKALDLGCGFGGGANVNEVFKDAGLILITNAGVSETTREEISCKKSSDILSRARRSSEAHECCKLGEKARLSPKSCRNQIESLGKSKLCIQMFMKCCRGVTAGGRSSLKDDQDEDDEITEDDSQVQVRNNFPETWLFGDVEIGPRGEGMLDVTVPDTITTWILQAFAISKDAGLGVAQPYQLVAFKEFFVQLNLPYSVYRSEQLMLSATLFNYAQTAMRSRVFMSGGKGLCYIKGRDGRTKRQFIRLRANDALTLKFPVIPTDLGDQNVTVVAYTADGGDAVTRKLRVEPEGIEQVKTVSKQIDPSASTDNVQVLQMNVDIPGDSIPGSDSATLFLTGDLLGPIATKLLSNARDAIINPVERYQVSVRETYTVQVPVQYTQTRTEIVEETYRVYTPSCVCNVRPGGCFGKRRVPRTVTETLTRQEQRTQTRTVLRQRERFVMRSMGPNVYVMRYLQKIQKLSKADENQAKAFIQESYTRILAHRTKDGSFSMWGNEAGTLWLTAFVMMNIHDSSEFITVDRSVICQAIDFVLKSQKKSGAFLQEGEQFSKGMMGGTKGDPAMTAFIMVALIKTACSSQSLAVSKSLSKAEDYLMKKISSTNSIYDLALMLYAFSVRRTDLADIVLERLEKLGSRDKASNTLHWKAETESVSIEATAYVLLALVRLNKLTYAKPIIKWLTEHKDAEGGFSSGQDTVVGLQALSEYATVQPELFLRIVVTSTSDPTFRKLVTINKRNALVQSRIEVPIGGHVVLKARGVGIAEAQTELHYNIPKPPTQCQFDLDVSVKEQIAGSDYFLDVGVCARYLGKEDIGMSVMEIGILTGFVPLQESLNEMLNKSVIARYELSDRAVVVYFRKIGVSTTSCAILRLKRAFDVGLVQPASVTVKDFLDQDSSCTKLYSPSDKSPVVKANCEGKQCKCTQRRCPACSPSRIKRHFCSADYAVIARVISQKTEGSWKLFSIIVDDVYKGDVVRKGQSVTVQVKAECRCPRITKNRKYVIMASGGSMLVIDDDSYIVPVPGKRRGQARKKLIARLTKLKADSRC